MGIEVVCLRYTESCLAVQDGGVTIHLTP